MTRERPRFERSWTRLQTLEKWASLVALLVYSSSCGSREEDDEAEVSAPVPSPFPDAEFRYRTEYLDIAPISGEPVCAGSLVMMDDHIDHVLGRLGLAMDRRVPVYLGREGGLDVNDWCHSDRALAGCYGRGVIVTNMFAVHHEIVHAITFSQGRSWWEEGVAYAFAFHLSYSTPNFTTGREPTRGESGHLSRWLIERYGGETYMKLYERTPRGADQATVEAALRDVLGLGLEDLLSEYARSSAYVYPDHLACYTPPGAVESPWVDDFWEHEVTVDCEGTETFSVGDSEEQRMYARIPITLPEAGYFRFIADHEDVDLKLQPCLVEPAAEPIPFAENWPLVVGSSASTPYLLPGTYVLLVEVPPGEPRSVRLAGYPEVADHLVP